jgi:predicted RND superfamily exporter protein
VVVLALVVLGLGVSRTRLDTRVGSFIPQGDPTYQAVQEHDRVFGADPVVVVLHGTGTEGLLLDQEQLVRLVRLEGQLAHLPNVAVVYGPGTVLNQTAGAIQGFLQQVAGERDGVRNLAIQEALSAGQSKAQAQAAGAAAVARVDARYGPLLVKAMPMGLPTLSNPQFVASVLLDQQGDPRPEWRFLVPDAKSATVLVRPKAGLSQEANASLVASVERTVSASGLSISRPLITGVPVLTAAIADQAQREVPRVGLAALVGVALVFLIVPWVRKRRFRLLPLASAVLGTATVIGLFGLARQPLTLGAVAFLPVLTGIGSDFPLYLFQAQRRRRVLVAAAGGAVAFATLILSPLPFVSEFGMALTIGIVATVAWALALRALLGTAAHTEELPVAPSLSQVERRPAVVRAVAIVAALAAAGGWVLLAGIPLQSSPEELAAGLPALRDVTAAEDTLGFSGELDVMLHGPNILSPAALAWSTQAEATVVRQHGDQMRPLLTYGRLLAFLGPHATGEQVQAGAGLIPPYLLEAAVSPSKDLALSTYGIRLDDVRDQQRLIAQVQQDLPPTPAHYTAELVGIPVVAARGLDLMSSGRYLVNLGGILAAALVVGLGLRSRRDGLAVAAAALLAAGWIFLGSAALHIHLSPLTLAVGALVTVTSCEFATMLSSRVSRGVSARRNVLVAATAGTIGYGALALSNLAVLREFGLTLGAGVISSYLAALLVTALLNAERRPTPAAVPVGAVTHPEKELVR